MEKEKKSLILWDFLWNDGAGKFLSPPCPNLPQFTKVLLYFSIILLFICLGFMDSPYDEDMKTSSSSSDEEEKKRRKYHEVGRHDF